MRQPNQPGPVESEQSRRNSVTAHIQMKKDRNSLELPDLAALLDGEIHDEEQLAGLSAYLQDDSSLNGEFAAQREVKRMLGSLPEYEAPSYLATRVIGEIAARRKLQRSQRLKPWLAAAGGFAACLALGALMLTPYSPLHLTRHGGAASLMAKDMQAPANGELVRNMDSDYVHGSWSTEIPVADSENMDPQVKQFLEFVNEAHGYRVMMRKGTALSPDLPEAMMVLGEQQPAGQ
jgi:hypothetical protein